ncbi:MAG: hypothetical protein ACE15C_08890 [Phycisphaerae bacterium]
MSHRKTHWFEKAQVQLATAAALAVVYFVLEPATRPWDPQAAVAFVPYGRYGALAVFAGVVCLLAACAALLTVSSRPEGALLAALIGVGGFSLRSPQIRTLMWLEGDGTSGLFGQLILEMLLLVVVLAAASIVIFAARRIVWAIVPAAVWQDPLEDLTDEERQEVLKEDKAKVQARADMAGAHAAAGGAILGFVVAIVYPIYEAMLRRGSYAAGTERGLGMEARRSVSCLAVACLVCVPLLWLLMRSGLRGQIIFALLVSNSLGILLGHQFFPTRHALVAWAMPMLIGILLYALAAASAIKGGANAWVHVSDLYQALPVDWLTAGAGGGVLGFWVSERIHEMRHFERKEKIGKDPGRLACPKS